MGRGVFPLGSVLKLDFDWTPPTNWYEKKIDLIRSIFHGATWYTKNSERGFHLFVHLNQDLIEEEICMWQWVFGDDQDRTRLNYARMRKGVKNWNKLFVRKIKK